MFDMICFALHLFVIALWKLKDVLKSGCLWSGLWCYSGWTAGTGLFGEGSIPLAWVQVLYHLQVRELDAPPPFSSCAISYVHHMWFCIFPSRGCILLNSLNTFIS